MPTLGGRVRPPSLRAAGSLAEISRSRLNLQRLVELDTAGELLGVIDVVTSEDAFLASLRPGAQELLRSDLCYSRGTSRHMLCHLGSMVEFGVVRAVPTKQKVVLPVFTVSKKTGGLRLVADGRKLNRLMQRPPQMRLPGIRDVILRFMNSSFVIMTDARSWFYQFPLHPAVSRYFGINVSGARGGFTRAEFRVMVMGWNWAPCIAQRATRVLLPEESGLTWVDNFFVVGDSREEVDARYREFLGRCRSTGVELNFDDPQSGLPLQSFDALGLHFDLAAKRFRMSESWVSKLLGSYEVAEVRQGSTTPRGLYKVMGAIVWVAFTQGLRLCRLNTSMSFLRRVASALGSGSLQWDDTLSLTWAVQRDLLNMLDAIEGNPWSSRPPDLPHLGAWSDASSLEWAALLETSPESIAQGSFRPPSADLHIYCKELLAALQVVRLAATGPPRHLKMFIDNASVVAAISRGHSRNYMANEILVLLFDVADAAGLQLTAEWVSTHAQRADEYTRGVVAPPGTRICSLPPLPPSCPAIVRRIMVALSA